MIKLCWQKQDWKGWVVLGEYDSVEAAARAMPEARDAFWFECDSSEGEDEVAYSRFKLEFSSDASDADKKKARNLVEIESRLAVEYLEKIRCGFPIPFTREEILYGTSDDDICER